MESGVGVCAVKQEPIDQHAQDKCQADDPNHSSIMLGPELKLAEGCRRIQRKSRQERAAKLENRLWELAFHPNEVPTLPRQKRVRARRR